MMINNSNSMTSTMMTTMTMMGSYSPTVRRHHLV